MRALLPSLLVLSIAATSRAGTTGAGDDEATKELDALIARALENAPELPAYAARTRAARTREAPAAALPAPEIDLGAAGMGLAPPGPASTLVVEVSQELPYPGKRAARRAAAEGEASILTAEAEDARRRVVAGVRVAYARVYALDREREKLDATRDLLGLLSRAVAARYSTGEADRAALLRVDLEASRLEERQISIAAERRTVVASLNRLLGLPSGTPFGAVRALPRVATPDDGIEPRALAASSEIASLHAEDAAAARRAEAARFEEKPDFSIGLGGGVDGMAEPVVTLRLGMTLPIWRGAKQAPLAQAAEEDRSAVQDDIRAKEAEVRERVEALRAALGRDDALVALYAGTLVPRSRDVFEATQASYLAGRGDFPSLIESYDALLEAEVSLAQREAARFESWALLEQLEERR